MKELTSFEGVKCANCGTPLEGEFCHHCGQSVHSVLRPVHGLLEEFFETFLHIDGRILHTLPPLMLKPGFLTLEYFSGRRVRYIAPFRLMFVMCLLCLFMMHMATDLITSRHDQAQRQQLISGQAASFADDESVADVNRHLKKTLETLEATRADNTGAQHNAALATQLDVAEQKYRDDARIRLTELGVAPAGASSASTKPVDDDNDDSKHIQTPVHLSWLPDFANQRLTLLSQHIAENIHAVFHGSEASREQARDRLTANVFSALPGIMLTLIPVFGLLLVVFYLFKRRLYMEHLIVALHSHAFLFASLLIIVAAGMLSTWLRPHAHWTGWVMGVIQFIVMVWIPIYLLIMQKRVYRQGWLMTGVKYAFIGWLYIWLFSLALAAAAIMGLAH